MNEERPRRFNPRKAPEAPSGYRQSRRGSKSMKGMKKAERKHRAATVIDRLGKALRNGVYLVAWTIGVLAFSAIVVLLVITTINTVARWNAKRIAAEQSDQTLKNKQRDKEDVLIIGADGENAAGFLALRVDERGKQIFGVAIPDGAFIDVPGQGFERVGEALGAGPDNVTAAVSNFLGVPFSNYVVVPKEVYASSLSAQNLSAVATSIEDTNMSGEQLEALVDSFKNTPQKSVALVPLPVKPIKVGDQTYFEPELAEIADLLKEWWGVTGEESDNVVRVIVYNGSGKPGIAGEAAQVLIRSGFRVVDTKNADTFDYKTTQVVVTNGSEAEGNKVRDALGVGEVTLKPSAEEIADVIIVIGKDYKSPSKGTEKGTE